MTKRIELFFCLRPGVVHVCLFLLGLSALRADCNVNGIDDADDISTGSSDDCNANGVPDECEIAPFAFGLGDENLALLKEPQFVRAVDVNGDELTDLVVAEWNSDRTSNLSFLPAVASRQFGERVDIPVPDDLSDLAVNDVDSDGDFDFVTVHSSVLLVHENTGGGNFDTTPVEVAVPRFTRQVIAVNLNGDARLDLAATNTIEDAVFVAVADGDGYATPQRFAVGDQPVALRAADFDGDGSLDLAVANTRSQDVSVLLNSGAGSFGSPRHLPLGDRLSTLVIEDFNGDGAIDLIGSGRATLGVWLNPGDGQFASLVTYPIAGVQVSAVDVDADGDRDIVLGNHALTELTLLSNGGNGTFVTRTDYALDFRGFVAGDLDGDGDVDVAAGATSPPSVKFLWNGDVTTFAVSASHFVTGGRPHDIRSADLNGDGFPDVVTSNGDDGTSSILLSNGDGTLSEPIVRSYMVTVNGEERLAHMNSIEVGDFVGDSAPDLAAIGPTNILLIIPNDGQGGFDGEIETFPGAAGARFLRSIDLDGDLRAEIVATNIQDNSVSVFRDFRSEDSLSRVDYPVGSTPWAAALGDYDGDGRIDVATANQASRDVSILINVGDGTFQSARTQPLGFSPRFVTEADLNGDGFSDLAFTNPSGGEVVLTLNRGDATFEAPRSFVIGRAVTSVLGGDLDGDGFADLVTTNELTGPTDSGSITVLLGTGDGTIRNDFTYDTDPGPRFSTIADLDLDGDLDIVSGNRVARTVTVFQNKIDPSLSLFARRICTPRGFHALSLPARTSSLVERAGKYITPARPADGRLLETTYQNVRRFALHQEFLAAVFPDRFPSLGAEAYAALTARRATREYYAGVINRLRLPGSESESGGIAYGFTVVVDGSDSTELLRQEEVGAVYAELRKTFTLEPLGYFPDTPAARDRASEWSGAEFEIFFDTTSGPVDFEAYTQGVGFGRLRVLTEEELSAASETGEISFQNILVLEIAPRDIEGVFSGVVTGQRQVELSHLAIRTARRGTPNAYVSGALEEFREWDGQLVRLEVTAGGYTIRAASQEEAEEHWRTSRPSLEVAPTLDSEFSELLTLGEIAELESTGLSGVPRFGGKATNLSRLQEILTGEYAEYQEKGFAIPMRYYVEFMRENRLESFLDRSREVTYEEYVQELLVDESFQTDSRVRFEALDMLRDHMRDEGVVRAEVIALVAARVREVMGTSETTRVRFRSSSNVEDDLQFNGAGLYNSTSGCLADEFDGDEEGPSQCDSEETNERTITRALKRVWRSLWNFRAYEEREFFGIDQEIAAMGILVNRTFIGEASQGVAFTGNTSNILDRRYVVTAQLGEESVVSPEPGVLAETNVLELVEGEVVEVIRAVRSTLVGEGEVVVSEAQLGELGRLMWHMDENFPLDLGRFDRSQVLLDVEYKFMSDGELAVKQVRPFLLSEPPPPTPEFTLEVPEGFELCGVFQEAGAGRGLRDEYDLKSVVEFSGGEHVLRSDREVFTGELFSGVFLGPSQEPGVAVGKGTYRLTRFSEAGAVTAYRYTYSQRYALSESGEEYEVSVVTPFEFRARGEETLGGGRLVLSDIEFKSRPSQERVSGRIGGAPRVRYASCDFSDLPLWEVIAVGEDGTRIEALERFDEEASTFETSRASLERARVEIGGVVQDLRSYTQLVYSASRHNTAVGYWLVLNESVELEGVSGGRVRVVEYAQGEGGESGSLRYLGEDLSELGRASVSSERREERGEEEREFRRGDVNADGLVDLADALGVLNYLFRRAAEPSCVRAADADDNGRVNVSDAVVILLHLFAGGGPLPEPTACGLDTTGDSLSCRDAAACRP